MKFFKSHKLDILLILLFMVCAGLFSLYLGQDANWDLRNYHYYNPYSLINNRIDYDFAPAQLQSYQNPLIDLPNYALMLFLPAIWVGFLLGALHGINIWLVYKIACIFFRKIEGYLRYLLAFIVAVVGFLGAANISEVGTTFGDNSTSIFILAALLIFFAVLEKPELLKSKYIAGIGMLIGIAVGLKLTNAMYALSLVVCFVLFILLNKYSLKHIIVLGISSIVGFFSVTFVIFSIVYAKFHNPMFPYYNGIFKSEYAPPVSVSDARFLPKNAKQLFFYPFYFAVTQHNIVSELPFREIRFALSYIAIAVTSLFLALQLFLKRIRKKTVQLASPLISAHMLVYFILFFVISYICWLKLFSIYRYLIVLEFLAPLLIVSCIAYVLPFRKTILLCAFVVSFIILFFLQPLNWGRVPFGQKFVSVTVPYAQEMHSSLVFLSGGNASSFIVPFTPEDTRFVRIEGNFITPGSNAKIEETIHKDIEADKADEKFVVYDTSDTSTRINSLLQPYGFVSDPQSCKMIESNIGSDNKICKVDVIK